MPELIRLDIDSFLFALKKIHIPIVVSSSC